MAHNPEWHAEDLCALLARLDLSQIGAARLCGVGERQMHRWMTGEWDIPGPAVRLLRACEVVPGLLGWLAAQ